MNKWTYIYKDRDGFWDEGIRKRKLPWYANRVPNGFMGFVKITDKSATLYNKDWSIRKTIRKTKERQ